ncbi:unnamed protein product [Nippostrongylus brasiliensis]|uniref:Acyl-CoA dehydrogenase family member 9, mitochondrial (inferred by orthology to a human protein) n=1 Tax=Nippostrongylus brasiliensis TaxID=27835 RepID=A0A0N4YEX8_NIPBR|nr:unnamed protein product [Nippostrongylus brasiliensis]
MRPVLLKCTGRRSLLRCGIRFCSSKEAIAPTASKLQIRNITPSEVPVEQISLSRGLVMNKFEKVDDVKSIQGFTDVLKKSLALTVDHDEIEKNGSLTDSVKGSLNDNAVFAALSPSTFGGLGLGFKDRVKIFEDLSVNWNIYANVEAVNSLVNTLLLFSSDEMKEKYFPLINSGKCRPIIAIGDETCTSSNCEVIGGNRTTSIVKVDNLRCMGMHNANLVVLFATSAHHESKEKHFSCYLIDRSELSDVDKWEFKREDTSGLKAFDVGILNLSATLNPDHMIGNIGQGEEIRDEIASSSSLTQAAAAVGYGKRLLKDLAVLCNRTPNARKVNAMLSDDSGIQYSATEFALKVYVLESVSYYLAGLLDENLPVVLDIENTLIRKLTRDLLRSSISASIDIAGLRAIDPAFHLEKNIRDVATLLSLVSYDFANAAFTQGLVKFAEIAESRGVRRRKITNSIRRLFGHGKVEDDLRTPKLTHYIAEHAHPSLKLACQDLEFSISRVNAVISKLIAESGKNVQHDFATLDRLVTVIQNHLAMVAVISRSSRSYSIGLRNSDIEIAWATFICSRASRENWFLLEALNDYFGLLRLNPSLLNVGRAVFDMGGYQIESPIERNW